MTGTDTPAPPPADAVKVDDIPAAIPVVSAAAATATFTTTPLVFPGYSTELVPTSGYSIDDFSAFRGYGYGVPFSSYSGYGSSYASPLGAYGSYSPLVSSAYTPPTSLYSSDYTSRGPTYVPSLSGPFTPAPPRSKYSHPLHPTYRIDYGASRRRPHADHRGYVRPAPLSRPGYGPVAPPLGLYGAPVAPTWGPPPMYGGVDPRFAPGGLFPRPNPRLPDAYVYNNTPYRPYGGYMRSALPGWHNKFTQQSWHRGWGS